MRPGVLTVLAMAGISAFTAPAAAQSYASATGKGITAGALLGGEAVMITEAALGVRAGWLYIVGGLAGAGGGAVGGYFLEQSASPRVNIYLLAAGMGLVIPTTVAVLSATAYEPPVDYTEDRGPIDEPANNPPEPTLDLQHEASRSRTLAHSRRHAVAAPPSVVGWSKDRLTLSVPAIAIGDVFTPEERIQFGVDRETECLVSVLDVRF